MNIGYYQMEKEMKELVQMYRMQRANTMNKLRDGLTLLRDMDELYDDDKCKACNNMRVWCRGCGGPNKIDAMIEAGIPKDTAKYIRDIQFGCCSLPMVPCYLCNIFDDHGKSEIKSFWIGNNFS